MRQRQEWIEVVEAEAQVFEKVVFTYYDTKLQTQSQIQDLTQDPWLDFTSFMANP